MYKDFRLSKVERLCQQNKFSEAEKFLKELLSREPDNVAFLAFFAEVNLRLKKYKLVGEILEKAIRLAPDNPLLFYVRGRMALWQGEFEEAEKNLKRCIELDPIHAEYFAHLANIKSGKNELKEALALADKALEVDAKNLPGLTVRADILMKLNRKTESLDCMKKAFQENPDNDEARAHYGWDLLEQGEYEKAKEYFTEALKKNPNNELATDGMLQAIKAGNPLYRVYLKYTFFKGKLPLKWQFSMVLAFYLGMLALRYLPDENKVTGFLNPLNTAALVISVFLMKVTRPVSNFFLRFSKDGQKFLTKGERRGADFVTAGFAVFITGAVLYIFTKEDKFLPGAFFGFAMMAPLGEMFLPVKYKLLLFISAAFLFITGLWGIRLSFVNNDIHNIFDMVFFYSFIISRFLITFFTYKIKQ